MHNYTFQKCAKQVHPSERRPRLMHNFWGPGSMPLTLRHNYRGQHASHISTTTGTPGGGSCTTSDVIRLLNGFACLTGRGMRGSMPSQTHLLEVHGLAVVCCLYSVRETVKASMPATGNPLRSSQAIPLSLQVQDLAMLSGATVPSSPTMYDAWCESALYATSAAPLARTSLCGPTRHQ
jgi:hypothetical protein